MNNNTLYDAIVIGAGSAGCLTAGRLVGDHGLRVLLLEAGPGDSHPLIHMPAGFVKLLGNERYMTFHKSDRHGHLFDRQPSIPQGKVLGGGSSVNAMVYIRGQARDYDDWVAATGSHGWSFAQLLPHFTRMEGNGTFNNAMHGAAGPLKVSDAQHPSDLSRAFVLAAQAAGIQYNADFNSGVQNGSGFYQLTTFNGRRCSAVDAFLKPVLGNPKLQVLKGARVHRVLIEQGVATGVEFEHNGQLRQVQAPRVIVTAGALVTPQVLMLSGVGPAAQLRQHGIEVKVDLPGVGENLQDHHEVPVLAFCNGPYGYYKQDEGWNRIRNGLQYLAFRSGPVTSNGVEAGAFFNPDDPAAAPTLQVFCVPSVYLDPDVTDQKATYGLTLNSCVLRPRSRGRVTLESGDPKVSPIVYPNYLHDPEDMRLSIAGIRQALAIVKAAPLAGMVEKLVFPPVPEPTDAMLEEHCRRSVKTVYHPCGTCRMGRDNDPMAVLTPELQVRGVQGLYVFDASAWPTIISGNTNATTYAVADRGVALLMGEALPQPTVAAPVPMATERGVVCLS
jgi:choline dehydrogenase-like flavoprotein